MTLQCLGLTKTTDTAKHHIRTSFAAGHLPSTATTLTPIIFLRCFLLNGTFGYLYRKYGICYDITSHSGIHLIADLPIVALFKERKTMDIDTNKLRKDLKDEMFAAFFGGGFGGAFVEALEIDRLSDAELIRFAMANGIDISKYT